MKALRTAALLAGLVVAAGVTAAAPPASADEGELPVASRSLFTPEDFAGGPCSIEAGGEASSLPSWIAVSDDQECTPRSRCCKVCSQGRACGDSCISRSYTCHKRKGCACNSEDVCDGRFAAIAEASLRGGKYGEQGCWTPLAQHDHEMGRLNRMHRGGQEELVPSLDPHTQTMLYVTVESEAQRLGCLSHVEVEGVCIADSADARYAIKVFVHEMHCNPCG